MFSDEHPCQRNACVPPLGSSACNTTFHKIIEAISTDCLLPHFNRELFTYLTVDALILSSGSVICQAHKTTDNVLYFRPIVYSSQSVSNVEACYSRTELETLSSLGL